MFLPSRKADGLAQSGWRHKGQSFATLEEERDHLEIRKSVATTSQGQYEIYWDIKLFWVLTVLSVGYGFRFSRLWREQDHRKHWFHYTSTNQQFGQKDSQFLGCPWTKAIQVSQAWHPALHPAEPSCCSQVPRADKLSPPQTFIPLIPWTSAPNCSIPPRDTRREESKGPSPLILPSL